MRQQDPKQIFSAEDVDAKIKTQNDKNLDEEIQYYSDSDDYNQRNQVTLTLPEVKKVGKMPKSMTLIQDVNVHIETKNAPNGSSQLNGKNLPNQNGYHLNELQDNQKQTRLELLNKLIKEQVQEKFKVQKEQGLGNALILPKSEIKQEEPVKVLQPNPSGLENFILVDYSKSDELKKRLANDIMEPSISKGILESEKDSDLFKKGLLFQVQGNQQRHVYECDCLPVGGTSVLVEVEIDDSSDSDSDQELHTPKHRQVRMLAQATKQYVVRRRIYKRKEMPHKFLKQAIEPKSELNLSLQQQKTSVGRTHIVYDERQLRGQKMSRLKKKDRVMKQEGGIIRQKVKNEIDKIKREID